MDEEARSSDVSAPPSYGMADMGLESWSVSPWWGSKLLKEMVGKFGADQAGASPHPHRPK